MKAVKGQCPECALVIRCCCIDDLILIHLPESFNRENDVADIVHDLEGALLLPLETPVSFVQCLYSAYALDPDLEETTIGALVDADVEIEFVPGRGITIHDLVPDQGAVITLASREPVDRVTRALQTLTPEAITDHVIARFAD